MEHMVPVYQLCTDYSISRQLYMHPYIGILGEIRR